MMGSMGEIELAEAFEQVRAQGAWILVTDVLRMQGVTDASVDAIRAFHAHVPDGVTQRTVTYGTGNGRDLTGQLYLPPGTAADPRPAVVLVHGGGWMMGHAVMHQRHAAQLAADGFVALTINYRLVQEAVGPAGLDDARAAVRWVRANASELGVDPARVGITGGSAGGHIAAMVAATSGADPAAEVQAAVLWYPVVDLRMPSAPEATRQMMSSAIAQFVGAAGDDAKVALSPAAHVAAGHPPVMTLVGDGDFITPAGDCKMLHDRYEEAGVQHELVVVPGQVHGFEVQPAEWGWSYERMRDFFRTVL
jgi:acetyl esterase/lipase